jgi:flagellar protein FliS
MVNTSLSALELILHLYDGALEYLDKSMNAIKFNDQESKCENLSRAIAIIEELINSLNHDIGGEISRNLESLYLYMLQELTFANVSNNIMKIEHVIELLQILKSAWKEIK